LASHFLTWGESKNRWRVPVADWRCCAPSCRVW
jgi:hypothetical protein